MTGLPGSRWPEAKLTQLREFEAQGLSLRQMAKRLGCAISTVKRQREHCGLHRPSPIVKAENGRGYVKKRVPKGASTLPPLASFCPHCGWPGDEK